MEAKERDYEELLLLSHDAYHAKAVSLWWFPELNGQEMAQAEQGSPIWGLGSACGLLKRGYTASSRA